MVGVRWPLDVLVGPSDGWHWSWDAFPPVWFCVRALVLDGLTVPPFDRHTDGDGSLRRLGLAPETWRAWVVSVLSQHAAMGAYAQTLGTAETRGPVLELARAAEEVLRAPGSLCAGSNMLRARLNELFADYALAGEEWKQLMSDVPRLVGSGRQQRALWKALLPFHDKLETLTVFMVEYAEPAVMPLPPTSCLIAPDTDPSGFTRQIIQAAKALGVLDDRVEDAP